MTAFFGMIVVGESWSLNSFAGTTHQSGQTCDKFEFVFAWFIVFSIIRNNCTKLTALCSVFFTLLFTHITYASSAVFIPWCSTFLRLPSSLLQNFFNCVQLRRTSISKLLVFVTWKSQICFITYFGEVKVSYLFNRLEIIDEILLITTKISSYKRSCLWTLKGWPIKVDTSFFDIILLVWH